MSAEANAGINILEVVELGGSVSGEHGTTDTHGRQMEYKVIVGTPALTVTQVH